MIGLILVGLLTSLIVYVISFYRNVARYPKGPLPLPFIGNILQLDPQKPHISIEEMAKTHGPIFTVFLPKPMVVLMKYDDIKEAFITKGDDFSGRSNSFPDDIFQNIPNGGVIFSQGAEWKENRRESLHILRDFGMGKNLMEELVKDSLLDLENYIKKQDKSKGINLRMPIQMFVANIIHQTLFGSRHPFEETSILMKCSDALANQVEEIRKSMAVYVTMSYPWIQKVPFIGGCRDHHKRIVQPLTTYIESEVERTLKDYNVSDEPTCFTQAYYQRMHNNGKIKDVKAHAHNLATDFFLAGMETTSTTLRWASLFMAQHQDVQDKCREEILRVIGAERLPSMADKPRMPYTSATVLEIQRVANILGFNVLHRTERDTSVGGVPIPNDTIVLGQIHRTMCTGDYFVKPSEFDPTRFLKADGSPNKEAADRMVAFSIGKPQCAGEGLARVELFLGLSFLLQKYKLGPRAGETIDLSPIYGSILLPKQHILRVEDVVAA